jgi:hypothetical protein
MKALKYGFGLVLIAGLALNASCGGSSSDNSDSTAGTSSSTAGDSSTVAGASSSSAGSDNTIAGGSSVGGDTTSSSGGDMTTDQGGGPASDGGAAGRGGMGRAGAANGGAPASGGAAATNPADCPTASLMENAMCTPLATTMERCKYGDDSCRCVATGRVPGNNQGGAGGAAAAATGRWMCAAVCPTEKPTVGADCTQGLTCPFTGGACLCGQSKKWQCAGGGMMGGGGANGTGGMSATGGGGNDGTMCPMQKPRAGGTCAGTGACTYANKTGCACVDDKWLCD